MYVNLIEQAVALARAERTGAPRQASLPRAVSSAYYGLFHYLIEMSSRAVIGSKNSQQGYRNALARAFTHQTMKSACSSYSGCQFPNVVTKALSNIQAATKAVNPAIVNMARTFLDLQQKRHLADYDLSEKFSRTDVLSLIESVEKSIQAFEVLPASDERQFFLVGLLVWKELTGR